MDDVEILKSFAVLNRTFLAFFSSAIVDKGISYSDGIILANIGHRPGTSQDTLVLDLIIDKAAVARAVKNLKAKGLIRVKRSTEDRRANVLLVTAAGEKVVRHIDELNRVWISSITAELTPAEHRTLFPLVQRMAMRARSLPVNLL